MSTLNPYKPEPALVTDLAHRVIAEEGLRATVADVDRVATQNLWPEALVLDSGSFADLLAAVADRIAELRELRAANEH